MEDPLEGERHGLLAVVTLSGHLVDGLAEQVREVQHLRGDRGRWRSLSASVERCFVSRISKVF